MRHVSEILRLPAPAAPVLMRCDLLAGLEPVAGRRVALAALEGSVYGYRAAGEPYVARDGHSVVDVVPEAAWWAHRLSAAPLEAVPWPAGCVWAELGG